MDETPRRPWPVFRSLQGAGWPVVWSDLVAGLTLAAIAIPEQMATARLGGFEPQTGFVAFIAASIAFAALGGSRFLSAGADSTITPIFAGALGLAGAVGGPDYFSRVAALALMVGALLFLANLLRAGWIADLLSSPVTTGFLAGVSLHIAVSQAPTIFGLRRSEGPLVDQLIALAGHISELHPAALAIGLSSLLFITGAELISPRIPGALIALIGATVASQTLDLEAHGLDVIGAISSKLPKPAIPPLSFGETPELVGLAAVITLVVMVQTAATARAFPAPGETPDIDRDFLGLAAGCALAGVLGAFPVNASPPRTAIVAETGGRSQLSGLYACAVIAVAAAFGRDALAHIPAAALAAVLMFIAARIFRVREMAEVFRKTRPEFALIVITMLAVALLPVQTGVGLAIVLSLIHGLWTTTRTHLIEFERLPGTSVWWPASAQIRGEKLEGVLVVAFQAPLSFVNAYSFQQDFRAAIDAAGGGLKLVVLEASSIVEIDFTASRVLHEAISNCRAKGADFAMARLESLRAQAALERFSVLGTLGAGRLFKSVDEATRALAPHAALRVPARRSEAGSS